MTHPPLNPPPKGEPADLGYEVARAAAGSIPGLGAAAQTLLENLVRAPMRQRQEAWFAEVFAALESLRERGLDLDALSHDERFTALLGKAAERARFEHRQAKREALRNAVLNIAMGFRLDDAMEAMFMNYIDRFSAGHLQLLRVLDSAMADPKYAAAANGFTLSGSISGVLAAAYPELTADDEVLTRVFGDLVREGLVNDSLKVMMTASGVRNPQTTAAGRAFVAFIRQPA